MKRLLPTVIIFLTTLQLIGQGLVDRIEPPFWWTGMKDSTLQLMMHGDHIAELGVITSSQGVKVTGVRRVENPDYLFVDLVISHKAEPGNIVLVFQYQREILFSMEYELRARDAQSAERKGFGKDDVIYLLMPDRFSNGNPANDSIPGMLEKADRSNPNGRHGGDISGILKQVSYLRNLGITAVWINPLLENNQPHYTYHGYAITDFYQVDPRFGTNDDYKDLVEEFHKQGIKVIMDMVFNHIGINHWWMSDMPMESWIHQFPQYTRSNFRTETIMDPYGSDFDRERMLTGWFDKNMPDLNQHNTALAKYLVQNSIWWVEYAGLDGIRMDTYPYSYEDFMAEWMQKIGEEYPNFSVVGETWLQKEMHTAYWQEGSPVSEGYRSNLFFVTDFPMYFAIRDAFTEPEGWTTGLARLYYVLSQDFAYKDPFDNIIFADNHDLTRIFTSLGEDYNKFRMVMAFLLTTRGIPVIYYGTEYLMTGKESDGHGYIRQEFVGGSWQPEDNLPEVTTGKEWEAAHKYVSNLLNWRKNNDVIHHGKLKQFVPGDGIYAYARYDDENTVMVFINKNDVEKQLDLGRFREVIGNYSTGKDVITQMVFELNDSLSIQPETPLILELK